MGRRKKLCRAPLLRDVLGAAGLTHREFAQRIGVQERTVRRWVAGDGEATPRYAVLAALSVSRGVDARWEPV